MGWKSTIYISRAEAKRLIMQQFDMLDNLTNQELGSKVEELGYGDDMKLSYFGYDFNVVDEVDPCDNCHTKGSEYCAQSCKDNK